MRDTRPRLLVLTLVAAQFVVMLDSSILNVALPSIAEELRLDPVETAWVLNGYFLSFGGLLLVSGRAADVFGRRRMVLIGVGVLVGGSAVGAIAPTEAVLVTARLLQGAGAAMLSPAAMSVILARFTGKGRAGAMSAWGAASTVGGAAGVTIGGLVTSATGWRSVFVATAIVAAIFAVAAWMLVPGDDARAERRSFDAVGAGLLTAAAVAVVFAVLSAPHRGIISPEVLGAAAVAVAGVVGFVVVERRSADPVLPLPVLRDVRVSVGITVNLLGGAARVACFVLVALLLQQVLGYGADVAGLAMLPTSLAGFAVSTLLLPRALNAMGAQRVTVVGLLLLAAAHALLSMVDHGAIYPLAVLPALLIAATGVAFSFTPTTMVIAEGIAARNAGVSSGLASATAQIGGAMGIAVFGAIDAANRAAVLADGGGDLSAAEVGLQGSMVAAAAVAALAALIAAVAFPEVRSRLRPRSRLEKASDERSRDGDSRAA